MDKYINSKKINIILFLLLIVGLIFIWFGNGKDYYLNYISYDKFDYTTDFETIDEGIKITESTANKGIVSEYENLNLEKGFYNIEINYKTNTKNNYIYLNGIDKKILLEKEDTKKIITIESNKTINSLGFKIYYSGDGDLEFQGIYINSQDKVSNDTYFYMIVYIIFILMCFYYIKNKEKINQFLYRKDLISKNGPNNFFIIALLLGTIIFISYPLFSDFIRVGHDISFQMNRIEGIASGLQSGQFPVRIHASTIGGYGHAASIYYPELFLYIPAAFRVLGLSAVLSYNIFAIMINIATVLIMYFTVYKIFKNKSIALISSIIYSTSVYRLSNLYFRFALGEVLAMVFLPLIIYALYELFFGDSKKWCLLTISYTLILQTHIISIFITTIFCILFGLVFIYKLRDKNRFFRLLKAILGTLLLNLWFLLPFLQFYTGVELNTSSLTGYMYDNTVYISQLLEVFSEAKGYNLGLGNTVGEMPFTTGAVITILTFVFMYFIFVKKKFFKNNFDEKNYNIALIIFIFGIISLFMSTTLFPWYQIQNIVPIVGMIQFPWRFIGFASVFLSISGAVGLYYLTRKHQADQTVIIILSIVCIITSGYFISSLNKNEIYLKDNEAVNTFESYWSIDNSNDKAYRPYLIKTNDGSYKYGGLATGGGEYLYKDTNINKLKNNDEIILSDKKARVEHYRKNGTNIIFTYYSRSDKEEYAELPLLYYPGYEAITNEGEILNISKGENNSIRVDITKLNNNEISLKYKGYNIWKIANIISLMTFMVLILFTKVKKNNKTMLK